MDGIYANCGRCFGANPGYCSTADTGATCNTTCASNSCDCAKSGAQSWTQYKAQCKVIDPVNDACDYAWVTDIAVCSTGDKYNSGNPPVMNAGLCSCAVGNPYKTCCSGTTPVAASHFPIDPYNPDEAGCGGNSTAYCGYGGYPACGAPACLQFGSASCNVSLSSAASSVPQNSSTTLSYTSAGSANCSLYNQSSPVPTMASGLSASGVSTGSVGSTTNYQVDCNSQSAPSDPPECSSVVQVQTLKLTCVTPTLTSSSPTVRIGSFVNLNWNSPDAGSCQLMNGSTVIANTLSGTNKPVSPTSNTTYTLNCKAQAYPANPGANTCTASVTVLADPTPATITSTCSRDGTNATLSWGRPPGATYFELSSDYNAPSWNYSCSSPDSCQSITSTSSPITSTLAITPGIPYSWWVNSYTSSSNASLYTSQDSNHVSKTCYPERNDGCKVPSGYGLSGVGYLYGDVDGDGWVGTDDAAHITSGGAISAAGIEIGDVNGPKNTVSTCPGGTALSLDCSVQSDDAQKILQFVQNSIPLPVCSDIPPCQCTDGVTFSGTCKASSKPQYCPIACGALVPNADGSYNSNESPPCGCPAGQVASGVNCIVPTPTTFPVYNITGHVFNDNGAGAFYNDGVKNGTETDYGTTLATIKIGAVNASPNSGGQYTFSNLAGGSNYNITFTPPAGFVLSHGGAPPNTAPRQNVSVTNANVSNINFGILGTAPTTSPTPTTPPSSISGVVYVDTNGDGTRQSGEPTYTSGGNILCVGLDPSGSPCAANSAPNGAGNYNISTPSFGSAYRLYVYPPAGYFIPTISLPSNFIPDGTTRAYWAFNAAANLTKDIGIRPLFTISGTVYIDRNNNGVYDCVGACDNSIDDDDPYTAGSTVNISVDGAAATNYTLTGSQYTIPVSSSISPTRFLAGTSHTLTFTTTGLVTYTTISFGGASPNQASNRPVSIPTANVVNINLGVVAFGALTGNVFIDSNNNGIKDGAEVNYSGASTPISANLSGQTINGNTVSPAGTYSLSVASARSAYNVQLTIPAGYTLSHSGVSPNTNPRLNRQTTDSPVNFGINPPATITGRRIADNDSSSTLSPADGNISGAYNVDFARTDGTLSGSVTADAAGIYTISATEGEYVITYGNSGSPAGYKVAFPGPPQAHFITIGSSCSAAASADYGASCSGGGNVTGLNFGFKPYGAWIQTFGSDFRFDNGVTNEMPAANASCNNVASDLGTGGTAGIVFSGGSDPNFGTLGGSASVANWSVGGNQFPEIYTPSKGVMSTSYNYMMAAFTKAGTVVNTLVCGSGSYVNCTITPSSMADGVYLADMTSGGVLGTLTLSSTPISVPAGKKLIILVKGDLKFNAAVTVATGGNITFISSRDMIVAETIGNALNDVTGTTPQLAGFYSADRDFKILGNNNNCVSKDLKLNLGGALIINAARGTTEDSGLRAGILDNTRTLCDQNAFCPVFTIKDRPDLILNAPDPLQRSSTVYQEVAP